MKKVYGNLVDMTTKAIRGVEISIQDGYIQSIRDTNTVYETYLLPGFIDSHVHIESSMMTPLQFARYVVSKGTVGVVTDVHEIANVLGEKGIQFMQKSAASSALKIYFTVPSCVPATTLDRSGYILDSHKVSKLLNSGKFVGLSEMMNYPGVLDEDPDVLRKIEAAHLLGLPIDGHAPGLTGSSLMKYIRYGINTDHECTYLAEAIEKIKDGMLISIREGSSARNYESLAELIRLYPDKIMFCTDDSHPDDLLKLGHIDKLVRRAVQDGYDLVDIIKASSINAVKHYKLSVGLLKCGDPADFICVNDLRNFEVQKTYINGICVFDKAKEEYVAYTDSVKPINNFHALPVHASQLCLKVSDPFYSIGMLDGQLWTDKHLSDSKFEDGLFTADFKNDILKIVYYNRYHDSNPQVATINGFGIKKGAIATSVAHDSHNILAVGCSDEEIARAINLIVKHKGGVAVVDDSQELILPLPIAGIISSDDCISLAHNWEKLHAKYKEMGGHLQAPFMTLSFMSLLVIPKLKIGEKGLFDVDKFTFLEGADT